MVTNVATDNRNQKKCHNSNTMTTPNTKVEYIWEWEQFSTIEQAHKEIARTQEFNNIWGKDCITVQKIEIDLGREIDDKEGYCPGYVMVQWKLTLSTHLFLFNHTTE